MIEWPVAELVPHAGDMILLDRIERFDAESQNAAVSVKPDGLFNQADGSLPA
jgi:predicted hotdog family 3-hydroxylacyl-ACP dehydratase